MAEPKEGRYAKTKIALAVAGLIESATLMADTHSLLGAALMSYFPKKRR